MGVTAFGVTVPSTPGFFGVIQYCFRISLQPFGLNMAAVLGASVYYHLTQYILVTATGLFFLSRMGLRLGDLRREAHASHDENADASQPDAAAQPTEQQHKLCSSA